MRLSISSFLDGRRVSLANGRTLGAALLGRTDASDRGELPYLFCGNGACRDCTVCVDGISDVATCRVPVAEGLSIRRGDGAGDDNALSRRLAPVSWADELVCDVAVVGGGRAGLAAARARSAPNRDIQVFEARPPQPRPVGVADGGPVGYENGLARPLSARCLILATGCRDVVPSFPGSFLPGVLPLDLVERYLANDVAIGRHVLVSGTSSRVDRVARSLTASGVDVRTVEGVSAVAGHARVERAEVDGSTFDVDTVIVEGRREPSLALAKALGCRTHYDPEAGFDVLDVDERGRTSVDGIEAVGSLVGW